MKNKFQFIKSFYNVQCLCVGYWFSTEKYLPFGLLEDTAVFMHLLWFKSYLCYNHILKSWVMLNLVCSSFVKVQWDWLYSHCCLAENINKKIIQIEIIWIIFLISQEAELLRNNPTLSLKHCSLQTKKWFTLSGFRTYVLMSQKKQTRKVKYFYTHRFYIHIMLMSYCFKV